ncbi:MAG: M23 family metallopeptidase [Paracoccaceae bacterium]
MTISRTSLPATRTSPSRHILLALSLGGSLLALTACSNTPLDLDWDLRAGAGNTTEEARQATAQKPVPDANGVLSYPGYQLAAARKGENVAAMAARLGMNPDELARTNALKPTDPLRAGELLLLPKRVSAAPQPVAGTAVGGSSPVDITSIATTALDNAGSATAKPAATAPGGGKEPIRHKVARGETAFTIARAYNVSARALADWNGLGADMGVREGQTLIIPVATAPAPNPEPVPTAPGQGSPTPEPPSAKEPLPDEKTTPAAEKPKETPPSPDLGGTSKAAKLSMPVQGKIIRGYDKKKNQGIDISAPAGTPVKAAEAGSVAVISADTNGNGIVILKHADGLLTVYVGVAKVSVAKGAKVSRGQEIGKVAAGDPAFLHFEIRNSSKDSLDPMSYLQ